MSSLLPAKDFFRFDSISGLKLTREAKAALMKVEKPMIVLLFGPTRAGKSTIGSALAKKIFPSVKERFIAKGGFDACTQGCQFMEPLGIGGKDVFLIDTEGLGCLSGETKWLKAALLTLLHFANLSLFVTMEITTNALEEVASHLKLTKILAGKNCQTGLGVIGNKIELDEETFEEQIAVLETNDKKYSSIFSTQLSKYVGPLSPKNFRFISVPKKDSCPSAFDISIEKFHTFLRESFIQKETLSKSGMIEVLEKIGNMILNNLGYTGDQIELSIRDICERVVSERIGKIVEELVNTLSMNIKRELNWKSLAELSGMMSGEITKRDSEERKKRLEKEVNTIVPDVQFHFSLIFDHALSVLTESLISTENSERATLIDKLHAEQAAGERKRHAEEEAKQARRLAEESAARHEAEGVVAEARMRAEKAEASMQHNNEQYAALQRELSYLKSRPPETVYRSSGGGCSIL
jgi:hypothetical protein